MGFTTAQLGDLGGRRAIVTGSNSGIGAVQARELAAHGAHVVLAVRNVEAGRAIAYYVAGCMDRECRNPRYSEQPDCVKLREDKRRRGLQ